MLLLIIAVVGLLIWQPWRASGVPAPAASTTAGSNPAPSASKPAPAPSSNSTDAPADDAPAEVTACTADQVTVSAHTDKDTYAAGEKPKLSMTLENTSKVDCTLDVGTGEQLFQIASGKDVYWRSTDCQAQPTNQVVTITAGQKLPSSQPLTWDRTRSSADSCDSGERPGAPAGGASYHLTVEIGGITSTDTAQFILN